MRALTELRFSTSQELGAAFHALEECPSLDAWLLKLEALLPARPDLRSIAQSETTRASLQRAALKLHYVPDEFLNICQPMPEHTLRASAEMFHSSVRTIRTRRVTTLQHCLELLGRCGLALQVRSQEMQVRQCARQMRRTIEAWQATPREGAGATARLQSARELLAVAQQLEETGYAVRAGVSSVTGGQCLTAIVVLRTEEDDAHPPHMLMVPRNPVQPRSAAARVTHLPTRTAA